MWSDEISYRYFGMVNGPVSLILFGWPVSVCSIKNKLGRIHSLLTWVQKCKVFNLFFFFSNFGTTLLRCFNSQVSNFMMNIDLPHLSFWNNKKYKKSQIEYFFIVFYPILSMFDRFLTNFTVILSHSPSLSRSFLLSRDNPYLLFESHPYSPFPLQICDI